MANKHKNRSSNRGLNSSLPLPSSPLDGSSAPEKLTRTIAALFIIAMLLRLFVATNFAYRWPEKYDFWGVFHYYLNAKYYPELGNYDLYACALAANNEAAPADRYWVLRVRDLRTYNLVVPSALPPCPREKFTRERWQAFESDFASFALSFPPENFALLFLDKGFNPPPSWVFVARPVAQLVPLSRSRLDDVVFNLDILAVLIGIVLIWRSRSPFAAVLTATLTVFYFGNFGKIGGNFLQYFWFPLLVAAVVFWTRRRPVASGIALGAAAALQAFPFFFAAPIFIQGAFRLVRRRDSSQWRPHLRLISAFAAVLIVSFVAGCFTGRGAGAWKEWSAKIAMHSSYLRGEIFNIGLPNLAATIISPTHSNGGDYAEDYPNTTARLSLLHRKIWIYYLLCLAFLAAGSMAAIRAPADEPLGHGLVFMYAIATSSPYYYFVLVLVPFMFWRSAQPLRSYALIGTSALIAGHVLLFPTSYISFGYFPHLCSELAIALFLFGIPVVSLLSRPQTLPEIHASVPEPAVLRATTA